jgi:ABC-type sulfate transport system permease component
MEPAGFGPATIAMQGDIDSAIYIAVVLVLISFAVIVTVRWVCRREASAHTQM